MREEGKPRARRRAVVARLRRQRPKDRFVRGSLGLATLATVAVWTLGDLGAADFLDARRIANLRRFLGEIVPYPLRAEASVASFVSWLGERLGHGLEAAWITLWTAIAAIVPAGAAGAVVALLGSRRLASPGAFGAAPPSVVLEAGWAAIRALVRAVSVLLRAVPEYVWAFFFVALLGPSSWPVVVALAVHNSGILGRLGSEVVDDVDPRPLQALRSLGAGRRQLAWAAILPEVTGRWLLFFFYRWETCVREATVLGMVGVVSLGYWIQDARARQRLDEMVLLILIGGLLVMIGDAVSDRVRRILRLSSG